MPDTRTALVTGATAGLGRAIAIALAEHGMHVLVHGRDAKRAAAVVDQITRSGGTAKAMLADLASLEQTRELADRVSAEHDAITLLVNNAGVGAGRPPYRRRQLSADGHELRLAVNYLAPALLAQRLIPALRTGAPARIVNVGSVGQAPVDFADLRMDRRYTGAQAYYRSKFALAAFTFNLAEDLADSGITVNCVHPASLMNTHMVRESMIPPMSTVAAGVRAVMNLATGPAGGAVSGRYFDGMTEARAHEGTYDPATRSKLRAVTAELLTDFLVANHPLAQASRHLVPDYGGAYRDVADTILPGTRYKLPARAKGRRLDANEQDISTGWCAECALGVGWRPMIVDT